MEDNPLRSIADYSQFIAELFDRPTISGSTITAWSASPFTGVAEGEVTFVGGIRLRLREELDFAARLITAYGYEVYRGEDRLYWYDDFPHPQDHSLASTFPHHKHIPPDIKHHRVPAPEISFNQPNLPFIVQEIEALLNAK